MAEKIQRGNAPWAVRVRDGRPVGIRTTRAFLDEELLPPLEGDQVVEVVLVAELAREQIRADQFQLALEEILKDGEGDWNLVERVAREALQGSDCA